MPVEAAEALRLHAVKAPTRPGLDRVEVADTDVVEPTLRAARAQVAALSLRLRSLTAAAERAEADPALADGVADAVDLERRRRELEDEVVQARALRASELDQERRDAAARIAAAKAEGEALVAAANGRLDDLVAQVARRVSTPKDTHEARPEVEPEADDAPAPPPAAAVAAEPVVAVPAAAEVHDVAAPEVTVLLEDAAGIGPDHARLVIADPTPVHAEESLEAATAAVPAAGPALPPAPAPVSYLTVFMPASDGQGGTAMVPVSVPTMAGAAPGGAPAAMPMPMAMPMMSPYGMGHPAPVDVPLPKKTFRERFLHLDVILPLLVAAIVLVLLLAWMG